MNELLKTLMELQEKSDMPDARPNKFSDWRDAARFHKPDDTDAIRESFLDDVAALRIKHGIPNLVVIGCLYTQGPEAENWGKSVCMDLWGDPMILECLVRRMLRSLEGN